MSAIVLNFGPDGNAECLHTDTLELADLGHLHVRRASTVEWSDAKQRWEVRWPDSDAVVFSHPNRSACIAWEVETLNARLASGAQLA